MVCIDYAKVKADPSIKYINANIIFGYQCFDISFASQNNKYTFREKVFDCYVLSFDEENVENEFIVSVDYSDIGSSFIQ